MSGPSPDVCVGTTLAGKYELLSVLGRGGMGVVFRGVHTWTNREVAVKVLTPTAEGDAASDARFLQEARTATALRHPNVVEVLDMGQTEQGTRYLVLELLRGETLSALLARRRLGIVQLLDLLLPVMDALAVAHDHGIVHRDLKPDNIFLHEEDGLVTPKLLDFGIAKTVRPGVSGMTESGVVLGTPHYLSPEQAKAIGVGPETDVWAMGIILHEALNGARPFDGDSASAIVIQIATMRAPSIDPSGTRLPAALRAAIDEALVYEREARHPNMRALAEAVVRACEESSLAIEVPRGMRRGRPASAPAALPSTAPMATPALPQTVKMKGPAALDGESSARVIPATVRTAPTRRRYPMLAALSIVLLVPAAGALLWLLQGGSPAAQESAPSRPGGAATRGIDREPPPDTTPRHEAEARPETEARPAPAAESVAAPPSEPPSVGGSSDTQPTAEAIDALPTTVADTTTTTASEPPSERARGRARAPVPRHARAPAPLPPVVTGTSPPAPPQHPPPLDRGPPRAPISDSW